MKIIFSQFMDLLMGGCCGICMGIFLFVLGALVIKGVIGIVLAALGILAILAGINGWGRAPKVEKGKSCCC